MVTPLFTINRVFDRVPALQLFDVQPFLEGMEKFLAPVKQGEKIFMAFSDPDKDYYRIMDGQRTLFELPKYIASTKDCFLFPDLFAVFDSNEEGKEFFWGRDIEKVKKHMSELDSRFVIVYTEERNSLEADWQEEFEQLGVFDWFEWAEKWFKDEEIHHGKLVTWYLLKRREENGEC